MNIQEHLMVCFIEECNEIAQDMCKTLRFGINDINPLTGEKNRDRINKELSDLVGVMQLLKENDVTLDFDLREEDIKAKKEKVMKYIEYAKERGTVK